jgi:hypothetical protein
MAIESMAEKPCPVPRAEDTFVQFVSTNTGTGIRRNLKLIYCKDLETHCQN